MTRIQAKSKTEKNQWGEKKVDISGLWAPPAKPFPFRWLSLQCTSLSSEPNQVQWTHIDLCSLHFFFSFCVPALSLLSQTADRMSLKAMTNGSTLANYRSPFLDNVLQHANGRNIDPSRSTADKSVCTFEHFSPGSSEQESNRHRMDIKLHWGGDLGKASLSRCFLWFSVLVERSSKYLRLETDGKLTDLVLQDYPEC